MWLNADSESGNGCGQTLVLLIHCEVTNYHGLRIITCDNVFMRIRVRKFEYRCTKNYS